MKTNMNKQENNSMKTQKTKTTSNRKNKAWLQNPDQLKSPKLFTVQMVRLPNGSFHVCGGESKYLKRINGNTSVWTKINTRDITCELNNSKVRSF